MNDFGILVQKGDVRATIYPKRGVVTETFEDDGSDGSFGRASEGQSPSYSQGSVDQAARNKRDCFSKFIVDSSDEEEAK